MDLPRPFGPFILEEARLQARLSHRRGQVADDRAQTRIDTAG